MAVQRDLEAEKRALKTYQNIYKKNPATSEDWNNLHNLAYPVASGGLPAELKSTVNQSLNQSTGNYNLDPTINTSNLASKDQNLQTAKDRTNALPEQGANEFARILQNAIKTKTGDNGPSQGLGTSTVFKDAGVTGFGSLASSLAAHADEIQVSYDNYKDVINNLTGTYKVASEHALKGYQQAFDEYKQEADRLQGISDKIKAHQDALDINKQQYDLDMKKKQWDLEHPDIKTQIDAKNGGYEIKGGKIVMPVNTVFNSPSGDTYDVAKYAQLDDGTPNPDHIAAMNDAAQKMKTMFPSTNGRITSVADIDKFIQQYYPGSPITGQVVANAAGKYGIDWETIIATMAAETQMGTDGSDGSKQYNFGNVGNTNIAMKNGNPVAMNSLQAGVNAVAKTLSLPIYKRNQTSNVIEPEIDPESRSIMAQTGLSSWAYILATQGTSGLTRLDEKAKTKAANEWRDYQIKHNIDGSTFKAQFEAANKAVMANSLRNNQAYTSELELQATIDNVKNAAKEAGLTSLKGYNIAKIWAGQQLNDPEDTTYYMHLQQLRNEFAMYNAAIAGQIDANGNIREINQAENEAIADKILQSGMSTGSIDGFQKALTASRDKMTKVLNSSVDAQRRQVWDLFGVGDKYKASTDSSTPSSPSVVTSGVSKSGNKFVVTKE